MAVRHERFIGHLSLTRRVRSPRDVEPIINELYLHGSLSVSVLLAANNTAVFIRGSLSLSLV